MLLTSVALFLSAAVAQSDGTVEAPFRLANTAIIVDVTVNGKKASLMFDTGAGSAIIVDDTMDVGKITGSAGFRDFVGEGVASTVELKTLKVGAKEMPVAPNTDIFLMPGRRYDTIAYSAHVDGILGLETFLDQVVEINFQNRKFIFHPKSMDITKRVPDNKRTFLLKMLPIGANSIQLEVLPKSGKKMVMALDTGNSFYATTYKETLERIGEWEVGKKPKFTKESGVATGSVESWTKKLTDMTVFGVPVPCSYWDIIDLPSAEADSDGTVGFGFLSNFNITVDFERRCVWLENFTGKAGNDEPGDVGLSFTPELHEKRITVRSVAPDGPADKAGIKVGDQLLSIDGKDLPAVIGWEELRRRLEGPKGSKVKLDFSRDGQLMRYELERACLVNE
jgi:hypothetical protein